MMFLAEQDFLAELHYLTREQGGRETPARTSYRPIVKFPFSVLMTSGQQTFLDKEWVNPGGTVTAYIKIVFEAAFRNSLEEGMEFEFYEPPRVIGYGIILKVINPVLKKV